MTSREPVGLRSWRLANENGSFAESFAAYGFAVTYLFSRFCPFTRAALYEMQRGGTGGRRNAFGPRNGRRYQVQRDPPEPGRGASVQQVGGRAHGGRPGVQ